MKRSRLRLDRSGRGPRNRWSDRLEVELLEPRVLPSSARVPATTHAKAVAALAAEHATSLSSPYEKPFNNPLYGIDAKIPEGYDPSGTGHVFQPAIQVQGKAVPYSAVSLAVGSGGYFTNAARADPGGYYSINVTVPPGPSELRVFAENTANQYSVISTIPVAQSNAIVNWDAVTLLAIRDGNLSAPRASRALAMVHLAQYDAIMAVQSPKDAYQVHIAAPKGASVEAAADSAAMTVLNGLFPSMSKSINLAMNQAILSLPKSKGVTDGFTLGQDVGAATLVARSKDGSDVKVNDPPSKIPGLWRPTPPGKYGALDAGWGQVTPFALTGGAQFRPPAPPAIGSDAYDRALAEVASLGRSDSPFRTSDQSVAAKFWADGFYSDTNPGHWNEIAESVAAQRKRTLAQDARTFAMLDVALADAAIATQDARSTFGAWRPVSAIQEFDSTWTPLVETPPSPSYVSGNAAYGAAASRILTSAFGPKVGFTDKLNDSTGLTRTFTSFAAAATEDGQSRIWAGDSFGYDVQQGRALGDQVGSLVVSRFGKGH